MGETMKSTKNQKSCCEDEKCGDSKTSCNEKEGAGCKEDMGGCGCCSGNTPPEVDLKKLGPEAVELGAMFEEVNTHLLSALKTRQKIIQKLHENAKTPEMKEKMDQVLASRHPVLLQFVLGQ